MTTPTDLVRADPAHIRAPIELLEEAHVYLDAATAASTRRAYRSAWQKFSAWCMHHQVAMLPATPQTVTLYITDMARSAKYATISRHVTAISQAHQSAQLDTPTKSLLVRKTLAGMRRTLGTAQHGKAPLMTDDIRALLSTLDDTRSGQRDRALLLVGFAGAFRRSELVSLDVADLTFGRAGLTILLRRSKTDQAGEGMKKAIPHGKGATCPVRALQTWLDTAQITDGPIFRAIDRHGHMKATRLSDRSVSEIVKRCAAAAGLDPARFAGHSLRAGMATQAAVNGVAERTIQKQTGHTGVVMLRRYIRDGDLFRDNAAGQIGL